MLGSEVARNLVLASRRIVVRFDLAEQRHDAKVLWHDLGEICTRVRAGVRAVVQSSQKLDSQVPIGIEDSFVDADYVGEVREPSIELN